MTRAPLWLCLAACLVLTGCSHFAYRIVEPSQFAGTIGREPLSVDIPPLHYSFVEDQRRLNIQVANRTSGTVRLVPEKSYVVDPAGETHSLRGRVVAPGSFVRMALPPRSATYSTGPSFGFRPVLGYPYADPFHSDYYYAPSYTRVRAPALWDWRTGPVRLRFFYEGEGETFEHSFTVVRERAK